MKRKIILITIFLAASFVYQRANPTWIKNWGIDPTTYLFFSLLPLLWLFQVSSRTNSLIAIIFLSLVPFASILKYEQTAENIAVLAFFFIVLSVFQQIKQFIKNK